MDGTAELARLAELLRIGADAARKIADIRPIDADTIRGLAVQAESMAVVLEEMIEPLEAVAPAHRSGDPYIQ